MIFLTFLVFSLVIYGVMGQTLLAQERNTVADTVNSVQKRLEPISSSLTARTVFPKIDVATDNGSAVATESGNSHGSVFSDAIVQKLSREDVTVTVYDQSGHQVFSSRPAPLSLKNTSRLRVTTERASRFDGLVARTPIVSAHTSKVIGYLQVTNALTSYHRTMNRVTNTIYVVSFAALVISAMMGFFLASRFLRPIRRISSTIDQINSEPQSDARIPALRTNDELSHLINEFNAMLDRIQRFIDQQTDFVGDVSHELRTPVAILEGHLNLLNRWGKDDPEVLDESLKASLQEVSRMKSLIQEMLDLTRADQVETQFVNAVTEVNEVVEQVTNDMQMIHPDFTITLEDELPGPTWVQFYRNHMEQVLIILVDNAVKYSRDRKEIHVSVGSSDDSVDLAVQDFGEGIAPQNQDRVFNRFYRVDKARSREKGGNGLGLSIAKQLIDGYHGTIGVESVQGSGSIFRISLPKLTEKQVAEYQRRQEAEKPTPLKPEDLDKSNLA
ncbi:Signal transduction histidine kinase [Lacticaseibacillus thailandensis DSM 22698 = JCM 13996]|uniref:Signal transduction histidine-protein kinase ArlS n=1 Tax=Lacticaseibacillus thailandensis DSM 22698 = JCM 13996 TaxID=1423810 RepID=A0A0R2CJM3_9LACO|nr:Signal transduction histidine kinase [Lacticaseibacillus thailandensis DSM 22698 = JCM 13996]